MSHLYIYSLVSSIDTELNELSAVVSPYSRPSLIIGSQNYMKFIVFLLRTV